MDDKKEIISTVNLTTNTINRLKILKGAMPKKTHDDVVNELIDFYNKNAKLTVKA